MAITSLNIIPPSNQILQLLDLSDWSLLSPLPYSTKTGLSLVIEEIETYPRIAKDFKDSAKIVEGLCRAILILIEIEEWERALLLLQLNLKTKTKNTLFEQLGSWGHFDLQLLLLQKLDRLKIHKYQSFYFQNMARIHRNLGNFNEAEVFLSRAIQLFSEQGNIKEVGRQYHAWAVMKLEQPDIAGAKDYLQKSIRIFKNLPEPDFIGIAQAYHNLTRTARYYGDFELSMSYYKEAIKIYQKYPNIGAPENKAWVYHGYSDFLCEYGKYRESEKYGMEALQLFQDHNVGTGWTYIRLAKLYFYTHKYAKSHRFSIQANQIFDEVKDERGKIITLHLMGKIELVAKNYDKAIENFTNLLRIISPRTDNFKNTLTFEGFGFLAIAQKKFTVGTILLSKVEQLRIQVNKGWFPAEQEEFQHYKNLCLEILGAKLFQKQWVIAHSLSLGKMTNIIKTNFLEDADSKSKH